MEKKENGFVPCKPREMKYHDYLDYWVCDCGNFEKEDGFMACTSAGNLINPIGARYGRCERCGNVFEIRSRQIIGFNKNPDRGRF